MGRYQAAVALGDDSELELMVLLSLWGNRMDLSLWPADAGVASSAAAFNQVRADSNAQLLADDTPAVVALLGELRSGGGATIDLVVDNAGFELPHSSCTCACACYMLHVHCACACACTCHMCMCMHMSHVHVHVLRR